MNLSLCFDSVQRVRPGGSLHRKAAVEGERRETLHALKHQSTVDLN